MRDLFPAALKGLPFVLLLAAVAAVHADFPPAAKLPAHPGLPDPLTALDGHKIKTKAEWLKKRRPELKKLFQHYMYGYAPPKPANLAFVVERTDRQALGGKATLKEVTISFGPPGTPKLHLLLFVPNKRKGPAPVFLGMNFCGNHTLVKDPKVRLPKAWLPSNCAGVKDHKATDAGRGTQVDVWAVEQTIGRGYAVATLYCGDADPDRTDKRVGIQPHLLEAGQKPGSHDWGSIAAWAWALQRAVDYLVTDADIDATKIIIVGHSRLGKTALLAAAFDERVAMAIPHQAGCGGTAPRGTVGESVKQINDRFPHWFNGAFKEFNDHPNRLPFDQHCLIALMAPRPVFVTNAVEDAWANPAGQFEMLKAAEPVYALFGVKGVTDPKVQLPEAWLSTGRLGYAIRPGKHEMNPGDWRVFCDYADRHLAAGGGAKEQLFVASPLTADKSFTPGIEGPACDAAGNVYAVNFARQQTIGKVTPDGKAQVWVTLPGKSTGNGLVFDRKGALYVADYAGHNVLRIDPKTLEVTVFAHEDRFNQPNDLAIAPDGTLYASDPNWGKSTGQVWRIDTKGKVALAARDLGTTNGIEVSPDGKTLYVNESVQRNVWAFAIGADGSLSDKRLLKKFPDHGFDGMRCDADGNLYVARYGKGTVAVLSPAGKVLREIDVLGKRPSNLCFGGPDGRTVYVTEVEHQRLVQFRVDRPGLAWKRWQEK